MSGDPAHSTNLYKEVYGTGDPMLCLHGLGASIYSWRHLIAPLSQNNQLVLLDLKGCGKSPKPADKCYSIQDHVDSVYRIIVDDDLRNLTLIGSSLGGAVALLLALRFAEEEPRRLSKLVLIDSAADQRYIPAHLRLARSLLGGPILFLSPSKLAAWMVLRMCYHDRRKITSKDVAAYASPIASPGGRNALLQTSRQCIPADADEMITKLSTLKVPTFILWGREDGVIPLEAGELLHQAIPNSTFAIIDQCGHIPHEERPEETLALISQFLKTTAN